VRAQIAQRWPLSHLHTHKDPRDPVTYALDQDLLSITEMRHLFPESELLRERVAGLIKSVIALRR
jgi:hypothetical protein